MRPLLPLFRNDWEARRHGKRGSLLWSLWWHYTDRFPSSWMWPWRPLCWLIGHEDDGGACITCGKLLTVRRQRRKLGMRAGGCSPACGEGHTYSWPCEQAMIEDHFPLAGHRQDDGRETT